VVSGKKLEKGQCYTFVQIPILGGDYVVANIAVRDIAYQYTALGPIFKKLREIPDGTKIRFKIE
jgi:hypothetical protein